MDEESRHRLKFKTLDARHEDEVVIQGESAVRNAELGKLSSCMAAIRTTPKEPTLQQWEKARTQVMEKIVMSRSNFITTLNDKMTATDSAVLRALYYIAIVVAVVVVAAALAAGAIFLIETLLSEPAQAIERLIH